MIVCFVTLTFPFCPTSGLQLTVIWTMFMLVFGFYSFTFWNLGQASGPVTKQLELESHTIRKHSPFNTVYMFRFSLKMCLVNFPLLFLPVQCSATVVLALCLFVTSRCSVETSGQIIFLTQRIPLTYHRQCFVETGVL